MLVLAHVARAEDELAFSDVVGWWSAEPTYAGESSKVVLHFAEENGKQAVRISLLGIGGYDVPIGTVTLEGQTLKMQPYPFPLEFNAQKQTLRGVLPEAAVPVYRIPVEFHRIEPLAKPAPPIWQAPRPIVVWQHDVKEPVWAGLEFDPAAHILFVATEGGKLHALNSQGKSLWVFDTGGRMRARPTVIDQFVYVSSDAGHLWSLDKRTGKERWRADVDIGSPARIPTNEEKTRWDRFGSSVAIDGERLYFASRDKRLYALDVANGKEAWHVEANDIMTATPAIYRDLVIFAAYDGSINAVKRTDGEAVWKYDAKLPVAGDLAISNGRVFAGSRTYDLLALDAASGKELWKHYYWLSWIESPPVVRDGIVYTGSSDATKVYAIDANSGRSKWETHVPGWAWARTAINDRWVVAATVGQRAYPGSRAGSLAIIDRQTGELSWLLLNPPTQAMVDAKQEWGFGASPAVGDGLVFAADLNGRVYALQIP
jgi:outer membrane protein assembly factor BamB